MNEYTNYEKYRTLCKLTKSELRKVQQLEEQIEEQMEEQENLPERIVVLTVTILDRLDAAPEECWDVSEEQNGLVLAWVEEDGTFYDLYIAGEGGINAKYCTKLFDGYVNIELINLNGHFHTEYATDMTSMFGHCHRLVELVC